MKKKKSKVLVVLLCIVAFFVIVFAAMFIFMGSKAKQIENIETVDVSTVKDGTYSGECDAGLVKVKVKVTVKDKKIDNIELIEHQCGTGKPAEKMIPEIEKQNTTEVDCVSGATMSSKTIKAAINNALKQGK